MADGAAEEVGVRSGGFGDSTEVQGAWWPNTPDGAIHPLHRREAMVRRAGDGTDKATLNALSKQVVGAAFRVHTALGPGLLESAYETCLEHELRHRGLAVERQKQLPVHYDDVRVDAGYRIDLLVEGTVLIEVKAVQGFAPIHEAQVLTYLKLSGVHLGLLLNFNVVRLKDGIKRLVHQFPDQ
jgi:GxxExxY protein